MYVSSLDTYTTAVQRIYSVVHIILKKIIFVYQSIIVETLTESSQTSDMMERSVPRIFADGPIVISNGRADQPIATALFREFMWFYRLSEELLSLRFGVLKLLFLPKISDHEHSVQDSNFDCLKCACTCT